MKIINWFIEGFKMSWRDFRYNTPWKTVISTYIILGLISFLTGIGFDKLFVWLISAILVLAFLGTVCTLVSYWLSRNKADKRS